MIKPGTHVRCTRYFSNGDGEVDFGYVTMATGDVYIIRFGDGKEEMHTRPFVQEA